jgi:hypothetical protein
MRTTIDVPSDLLQVVKAIAHDRKQSLSKVVTSLIEAGLRPAAPKAALQTDPLTGLPLIYLGQPTTLEDVRALDDDE